MKVLSVSLIEPVVSHYKPTIALTIGMYFSSKLCPVQVFKKDEIETDQKGKPVFVNLFGLSWSLIRVRNLYILINRTILLPSIVLRIIDPEPIFNIWFNIPALIGLVNSTKHWISCLSEKNSILDIRQKISIFNLFSLRI